MVMCHYQDIEYSFNFSHFSQFLPERAVFVGKIEVSSAQYSKLQDKSQDLGFSLFFSHF